MKRIIITTIAILAMIFAFSFMASAEDSGWTLEVKPNVGITWGNYDWNPELWQLNGDDRAYLYFNASLTENYIHGGSGSWQWGPYALMYEDPAIGDFTDWVVANTGYFDWRLSEYLMDNYGIDNYVEFFPSDLGTLWTLVLDYNIDEQVLWRIDAYAFSIGGDYKVLEDMDFGPKNPAFNVNFVVKSPYASWIGLLIGFEYQEYEGEALFGINALYADAYLETGVTGDTQPYTLGIVGGSGYGGWGYPGLGPLSFHHPWFTGGTTEFKHYLTGDFAAGATLLTRELEVDMETFAFTVGPWLETDMGFIKPGSFAENITVYGSAYLKAIYYHNNENLSALVLGLPFHGNILIDPEHSWSNHGWALRYGILLGMGVEVIDTPGSSLILNASVEYENGQDFEFSGPTGSMNAEELTGYVGLSLVIKRWPWDPK